MEIEYKRLEVTIQQESHIRTAEVRLHSYKSKNASGKNAELNFIETKKPRDVRIYHKIVFNFVLTKNTIYTCKYIYNMFCEKRYTFIRRSYNILKKEKQKCEKIGKATTFKEQLKITLGKTAEI